MPVAVQNMSFKLFACWDFLCFFVVKKISVIPSVSDSLDPDQAPHFVRPDLCRNYLQRLSADDTGRQRVK